MPARQRFSRALFSIVCDTKTNGCTGVFLTTHVLGSAKILDNLCPVVLSLGRSSCPSSAVWMPQEKLHGGGLMQFYIKPLCERWNNGAFRFWRSSKNTVLSKASFWSRICGETKEASMLKTGAVFCVGSLNIHIKTRPPCFLMWEMFWSECKSLLQWSRAFARRKELCRRKRVCTMDLGSL